MKRSKKMRSKYTTDEEEEVDEFEKKGEKLDLQKVHVDSHFLKSN